MCKRSLSGVVVPVVVLLMAWASAASALPITFDLRDPIIETFDEVNSFPLTQSGLTAVLTALPTIFNEPPVRNVLLNQTASSFGINVENTTCGGAEDSALLDGGCTGEAMQIVFDANVVLTSLRVSSFGSTDVGLVTIGGTTFTISSTGVLALGNTFLAAGSPWSVAFTAGNGFSLDSFTVDTAPEPLTLLLVGTGLIGICVRHRRQTSKRRAADVQSRTATTS